MDNKIDLRIKAKSIRKTLDIILISEKLVEQIKMADFYKKAKNVLIFYPTLYEINLLGLLRDEKEKQFFLPKVDGENLLICPYSSNEKLVKSNFNINEPCSNPVDAKILDLIFLPALAVDNGKNRLGYGGGYYDRFLKKYPETLKVVPISKELCFEKIPTEEYDVKADIIISM